MRKILVGAMLVAASLAPMREFGQAVGAANAAMNAGAASMEPSRAYDQLLSGFEQECTGVAKAMPAEKYGFSPASFNVPGAKFDGVRTFAGQLTHLIQANYYFFGVVGKMKPDVDMKAIGALKGKDEILQALAASFAFGHKAMATLNASNVFETTQDVDGMTTRGGVAAFAVAHGLDHYGQMVEYLRMNGVLPPGSK